MLIFSLAHGLPIYRYKVRLSISLLDNTAGIAKFDVAGFWPGICLPSQPGGHE
jgi:hypothetical protein